MNDQEIKQAFTSGDSARENEALRYIYGSPAFVKAGYGVIFRYTNDDETAKDIFQESIFGLVKNLKKGKFESRSTLSTYFVSICAKTAVSFHKKQKSREKTNEMFHHTLHPEETYDHSIDMMAKDAMSKADGECKSYFKEYYFENKSQKEIAEKYGTSEEYVKTKLYRCRKTLLKRLIRKVNPKLGKNCKDYFSKYYSENLSLREIAELYEMTEEDMTAQFSRCFQNVRQLYKETFG